MYQYFLGNPYLVHSLNYGRQNGRKKKNSRKKKNGRKKKNSRKKKNGRKKKNSRSALEKRYLLVSVIVYRDWFAYLDTYKVSFSIVFYF